MLVELANVTGNSTAFNVQTAVSNGSSSHRKMSDPSLEKFKDAITITQNTSSSQPQNSRLIKVNRSKKKLDTARRSRIQQLKDINIFEHGSTTNNFIQR